MSNLPALHEENDKRCQHVYPEAHEKAGLQCVGFHISDSPYCAFHGENHAKMREKRNKNAERRKELLEDLEFGYHPLESPEDVLKLTEKLVNGVLGGLLKKDKVAQAAAMLPLAYKIIRDNKMGSRRTMTLIQESGDKKLIAQFTSDAELDQFLLTNDAASVELLESLQDKGLIKLEKRKEKEDDIIDIVSTATPENTKIPAREIAKLTEKTDIPLKTSQVVDLFGRFLSDATPTKVATPAPDLTGFGDVFKQFEHEWDKETEQTTIAGVNVLQFWHVCLGCGKRVPNKTTDECPNPRKAQ